MKSLAYSEKAKFQERLNYRCIRWQPENGSISIARAIVKDRMEGSGMRWRITGAQSILSLRAIYLNNDWTTFWNYRIAAEQAQKYPYTPKPSTPLHLAT